MRRWAVAVAALVMVVIAAVLLWPSGETDEDRVRAVLVDGVAGANDADLGRVLGMVHDDYKDGSGLDKDMIRGLLFREFSRRGAVAVRITSPAVEVTADRAIAHFDAVLTEDAPGTLWPADADALHFKVDLVRGEDGWQVVSHERTKMLAWDTGG